MAAKSTPRVTNKNRKSPIDYRKRKGYNKKREGERQKMRREEIENRAAIGKEYGRWTVIGVERGKKGLEWVCKCNCGEVKRQKIWNIKSGRSVMCKKCSGRIRRKEGSR